MKLLPPREKNDCLESKFECRTDTIGLNLAAVSTVVRTAQGSSLAKLSFKADTDRCDCREFFTLNRCGGSVTKLKRRLAAGVTHVLCPIHVSDSLELGRTNFKRNFDASAEVLDSKVLTFKLSADLSADVIVAEVVRREMHPS